MKTLVISLVCFTLLCACGQKGALYLPQKPSQTPAEPSTDIADTPDNTNPNNY